MKPNIENGDLVCDRITKFSGIVTSVQINDNGITVAGVTSQEPKDDGGHPRKSVSFDFEDLEIITKKVLSVIEPTDKGTYTFGDKVRARYNPAFAGVVRGIKTSIGGCVQYVVFPPTVNKKGLPNDGYLLLASEIEPVPGAKREAKVNVPVGAGTSPSPMGKRIR